MVSRSWAGNTERVPSLLLRVLFAGILAFAFVLGAGVSGGELMTASQAKPLKRAAATRPTPLGPAAATGAFGLDLMRALPRGNIVLSPDSVAAALAMTGTGATGRTATEIARVLHLRNPAAFKAVGNLQRTIARKQASVGEGHPKAPTLELANGLFLQRDYPIEPAFLSGLQRHFDVVPETVDFAGDPSGSVDTINGWVSDRTRGLIRRLLASVSTETRLALANAVYLDADWRHPFEPGNTLRGPFFNHAGRTSVKFMNMTKLLRYGSGRGYKAVALPYRASTLSLLVVLPRGQGIGALQRRLGAGGLARLARRLSPRQVILSLPRFHLNAQTSLNRVLKSLGMATAFSDFADFSGITTAAPMKIGAVEHAADFTVDEEGTVAAAATAVGIQLASGPPRPLNAVTFNANRPFLFFLRDNRTGAVLFAGRVTKPALGNP